MTSVTSTTAVTAAAGPHSALAGRLRQIQAIQERQQARRASSPPPPPSPPPASSPTSASAYPFHPFHQPEGFLPVYPAADPPYFASGSDLPSSYIDRPAGFGGQDSYFGYGQKGYRSDLPGYPVAGDYPRRGVPDVDVNRGFDGGQGGLLLEDDRGVKTEASRRPDPYANFRPEKSRMDGSSLRGNPPGRKVTYTVTQPSQTTDPGTRRPDADPSNGSLTDDDKMNGTTSKGAGAFLGAKVPGDAQEPLNSDEEAERGLELLRQLHVRSQAAARLEREGSQLSLPRRERGSAHRQPAAHERDSDAGVRGRPAERENRAQREAAGELTPPPTDSDHEDRRRRAKDELPDYADKPRNVRGDPGLRLDNKASQLHHRPVSVDGSDEDDSSGGRYYSLTNGQTKSHRERDSANQEPALAAKSRQPRAKDARRRHRGREAGARNGHPGDDGREGAGRDGQGQTSYSLSTKGYVPGLPNSEPSYSRDPSPGQEDRSRRQAPRVRSQQHLRPYLEALPHPPFLHDSGRTSSGASLPEDDPAHSPVTFDRYARRATRASVLSKAEQLLLQRRATQQLDSISESDAAALQAAARGERERGGGRTKRVVGGGGRGRERKKGPSHHRTITKGARRKRLSLLSNGSSMASSHSSSSRKVAFLTQDDGDDDDDDDEKDETDDDEQEEEAEAEDDEGGFSKALSSFQSGGSSSLTMMTRTNSKDKLRKNRLQQLNARIKTTTSSGYGGDGGGSSPRKRVPKRLRKKAVGQSFSDYDQFQDFSSGSEEEGPPYALEPYEDPSRYEMLRYRHPFLAGATDRSDEPDGKKASIYRRAWFFRNGDPDFKPKLVLISPKTYPNFESLLVDLSQMVPTIAGVKYLFSWPEGKEIKSVTELQNGRYYICASVNRLARVNYGQSREQFWRGGKMKHEETHLFTNKNGAVVSSPSNPKPLVITVISNLHRDSHEKLILNPNTTQNFEDVLADIQNMINIPHPPVRALYTEIKPHIKVEGFTHLFRDLKEHKNFLVCGEEGVPIEPKKRPLPSSNSSNDSLTGKGSLRNSKLARGEAGRASNDSNRKLVNRRTEPIRLDINGRKREFFLPSDLDLDTNDASKPDKKMKLEWVYGFRGRDVKQNLVILPKTGELVYFVASVIVLYDRKTHTQKHYTGHTEEVTCLTMHPRDQYIASGQIAGRFPEGAAHVRIWDGLTLSTHAVIGLGAFQQGISCLSFSDGETNGDLLLAIDDSDRHVMSVWEWTRGDVDQPVAKTTTTTEPVVYGCFYPFDDKILITFGKQHMYFWTIFWNRQDGKILRDKKSGLFEDEVPKYVTTICFAANRDVITGDSTGSIMVWSPDDDDVFRIDRHSSASMKFAHKKSVSSLVMLPDGVLISGGDSEIKAWDSLMRYKLLRERQLPEVYGTIRKIVPVTSGQDGFMFVGTAKDIILEGSLQSKFRPIVHGHSEELWAVKCHPTDPAFFTAGHDSWLIKWSADEHTVIWAIRDKDKKPCTSMAVDPLGQLVAVGTTTGKVTLYGCGDMDGRERAAFQVGNAQVNAMSFSSDGSQLAVGCHDGFLHVYAVHEDGQAVRQHSGALRHGSTFIMHLDWSRDGRFLQAVLGDYDLVFWDVQTLQRLKTGRTLRDVKWNTCTCPVGFPLVGVWAGVERGEVVNIASRSKFSEYLVTGDSRGRLRLYRYPAVSGKADYRQVKPFSSNTTAVEFLPDDEGILASGGNDAALMQYRLDVR